MLKQVQMKSIAANTTAWNTVISSTRNNYKSSKNQSLAAKQASTKNVISGAKYFAFDTLFDCDEETQAQAIDATLVLEQMKEQAIEVPKVIEGEKDISSPIKKLDLNFLPSRAIISTDKQHRKSPRPALPPLDYFLSFGEDEAWPVAPLREFLSKLENWLEL